MQTITTQTTQVSPFALLMHRDAIRAAIGRAARVDLPHRECRPLDRYTGKRVSIDVARYDEGYVEESELDDEIDFDCFDEEDDNY